MISAPLPPSVESMKLLCETLRLRLRADKNRDTKTTPLRLRSKARFRWREETQRNVKRRGHGIWTGREIDIALASRLAGKKPVLVGYHDVFALG